MYTAGDSAAMAARSTTVWSTTMMLGSTFSWELWAAEGVDGESCGWGVLRPYSCLTSEYPDADLKITMKVIMHFITMLF